MVISALTIIVCTAPASGTYTPNSTAPIDEVAYRPRGKADRSLVVSSMPARHGVRVGYGRHWFSAPDPVDLLVRLSGYNAIAIMRVKPSWHTFEVQPS